jgi:hypothetical protein
MLVVAGKRYMNSRNNMDIQVSGMTIDAGD